jgi:hypothetical protein
MHKLIVNLLEWVGIWIVVRGIFGVLIRKGFDYVRHYIWTTFYFAAAAAGTCLLFRSYLGRILHPSLLSIVILLVVIFAQITVYSVAAKFLVMPEEYFLRYPSRRFLLLDIRSLSYKTMDIVSQQILIVLLVLFLHDAGLTVWQTIVAFALIFTVFHIPLILLEKGEWVGWYLTGFALLSAVLFPVLVLKTPGGSLYTFIIHWLFYSITAIVFWRIRSTKKVVHLPNDQLHGQ